VTEPLIVVESEAVMNVVVCDPVLLGIDDTVLIEAAEVDSEPVLTVTELPVKVGCE
jgi:hypothetical protein